MQTAQGLAGRGGGGAAPPCAPPSCHASQALVCVRVNHGLADAVQFFTGRREALQSEESIRPMQRVLVPCFWTGIRPLTNIRSTLSTGYSPTDEFVLPPCFEESVCQLPTHSFLSSTDEYLSTFLEKKTAAKIGYNQCLCGTNRVLFLSQ